MLDVVSVTLSVCGNVNTPAKKPITKITIATHLGKLNNLVLIMSSTRGFTAIAVIKNKFPLTIPVLENETSAKSNIKIDKA